MSFVLQEQMDETMGVYALVKGKLLFCDVCSYNITGDEYTPKNTFYNGKNVYEICSSCFSRFKAWRNNNL
jgi:hypothetical protein